ncbi:MAG: serine hydrolase domain-containing protein [Pseudomonadota bacterium]
MENRRAPLLCPLPLPGGRFLLLCSLLTSALSCSTETGDGPIAGTQDIAPEAAASPDGQGEIATGTDSAPQVDTPRVPDADAGTDLAGGDTPQDGVEEALPSDAAGPDSEDWYFPPIDPEDDTWETIPPEALGWDASKLQDLLEYLEKHETTAFVVLYKGRILVEQYWQGWDPHTTAKVFSVSKSVVAFLIGRAQAQGLLDIDGYVSSYVEDWSPALRIFKSKVTIRHLLTMTSGLTLALTFDAQVGTVWKYNTNAFKVLIAVLEAVTGADIDDHSATTLYAPTGMRDSSWQQDKLSCSARDMARFGLMILAGGQWDGQVLLEDPDYFAAMLDSSQDLNPAYGYLWWLNGKDSWLLPDDTAGTGPIIPSAPADLVSAQGFGDKKIYVVPSMHLVLVRHGDAAGETSEESLSGFDDTLWQLLMAAASTPVDGD